MTISDFAPLIQLGASIAIAVVAVESVRSYIKQVADRIYNFPAFIKNEFNVCREKLPDKQTLDLLEPMVINGKSTNSTIEKAKIHRESVEKNIDLAQKEKEKKVGEICKAKSLSSLNLTLFIYNIVLLLLAGLESSFEKEVHLFTFFYSASVFLFLIVGWFAGESESKCRILQFSSLRHSIISSIILLVLSMIVVSIFGKTSESMILWVSSHWGVALIVGILLTYLNYAVFAIKIGNSASGFKADVIETKKGILKECNSVAKEVEELQMITRFSNTLSAD